MRLVQLKKKRAAMAPRWKSTMKAVVVQMRPVSESARPMRTSARVFAGSVGSRAGEACSMWSRPEAGEGEAPRVSQVASVSASCEMLINCRLDSTVHFMSDLRHGTSGGFRRVAGPPGSKSLKAGMQCLADDEKITFERVVRREKALVNSGRQTRPGTGSLHPVAIEATAEATKPLKPSV